MALITAAIRKRRQGRERGIALIVVLWIITLLSIMAGSFAYSSRTETTLATFALERAQARALVEAGIVYAMTQITRPPDPENPWPLEGTPRRWQFGGGELSIGVVDSSGKLDLNRANRELLGGLLSAQSLEDEQTSALLDAIEDWRDPDDLKRLNGAELDEYLAAGRVVGPKNAPFENVIELLQVLGITPELYAAIAPELTVTGHKGLNPETASLALLQSLPGVDPELVASYVSERDAAIEQQQPLPPPPPLGNYLSRSKGLAYHMTIKARLATGTTTTVKAVVSLQSRRPGRVFHIVAWDEG